MIGVLFICMGNICRSPLADGIFSALVKSKGLQDEFVIDSAGTHDYHAGKHPDPNSIKVALEHGIDISYLISRSVEPIDFEAFHYIVAMDKNNLDGLKSICPKEYQHKITLLLQYDAKAKHKEVNDPYGKNIKSFNEVYETISKGAQALFAHIVKEQKLKAKKH